MNEAIVPRFFVVFLMIETILSISEIDCAGFNNKMMMFRYMKETKLPICSILKVKSCIIYDVISKFESECRIDIRINQFCCFCMLTNTNPQLNTVELGGSLCQLISSVWEAKYKMQNTKYKSKMSNGNM